MTLTPLKPWKKNIFHMSCFVAGGVHNRSTPKLPKKINYNLRSGTSYAIGWSILATFSCCCPSCCCCCVCCFCCCCWHIWSTAGLSLTCCKAAFPCPLDKLALLSDPPAVLAAVTYVAFTWGGDVMFLASTVSVCEIGRKKKGIERTPL